MVKKIKSLIDIYFDDEAYIYKSSKGKKYVEEVDCCILKNAKLFIHVNDKCEFVLSDLNTGYRLFGFVTFIQLKTKLNKIRKQLIDFRKTEQYRKLVNEFEEQKRRQGL